MADQAQTRRAQAAADYERRQREVRRGEGTGRGAHPLEFDESGFPLPQRSLSYIERMTRRLLDPQ